MGRQIKNIKEISIAVCSDENYALNAAMVLYSAIMNVQENVKIKAYIIDGGIDETTKKRFGKVIRQTNLEIIWLKPDLSIFDNLPLSSWTTKVAHARLLLPDIIPANIEKILYLDSDMLVIKNLGKLWNVPFDGNILLAWQDSKYPKVYKKPNSQTLISAGMSPSSTYFNSGLFLINISQWKKNNILSKYVKLLTEIGDNCTHCDQDLMNIILEGKWKPIDKHWQVASSKIFRSRAKSDQRMVKKCRIIHFTGVPPGFPRCRHPKKALFYNYVDNSGWFSKCGYFKWRLMLFVKGLYYAYLFSAKGLLKKLLKKILPGKWIKILKSKFGGKR
jgi:lipopolysaccharide biosynthesis glycosyltransferase